VVPKAYLEFMITAASAAGAMIGLLFVAISLRSDNVFGAHSSVRLRALANSSFTGLVNAFSLALLAVIPNANIGQGMIVLAALCFTNTVRMHRALRSVASQFRLLIFSAITYAAEFAGGVTLLIRSHETWIINGLCYVIFTSFALSLARAWALLRGEGERAPQPAQS
jgi:hypothetical protein